MKTRIITCNSAISGNVKKAIASRRHAPIHLRLGLGIGAFVLMGMLAALVAATCPSAEKGAFLNDGKSKDSKPKPAAIINYSKLPIAFEPNNGQSDKNVHFLARAPGGIFYFCSDQLVVSLKQGAGFESPRGKGGETRRGRAIPPRDVVRMRFIQANATPGVRGQEPLPGKVNYLLGNDPASWHTNLPTYAAISYNDLYRGTKLIYKGTGGQIEGTYVIEPGGDPSRIRWSYDGAEAVTVDAIGNLLISLPAIGGNGVVSIKEHAPIAWQDVDDRRQHRDVRYAVASDKSVTFLVKDYDPAHRLTNRSGLELFHLLWRDGKRLRE